MREIPFRRESTRPWVFFPTSMRVRFLAAGLAFFAAMIVLAAVPVLA
jgi:hypothetical protein